MRRSRSHASVESVCVVVRRSHASVESVCVVVRCSRSHASVESVCVVVRPLALMRLWRACVL